MSNKATNLMDQPKRIRHHHRRMSRRIRALLAEVEAWCAQERGRRAQLARYLNIDLSAVSVWLNEYRKPHPARQPTAEQTLALQEFLAERGKAMAPSIPAVATPIIRSETDTLLEQLRRWVEAKRGRRLLLAHEIDVPPALVSDWFAGRQTPTLEEGLRLKTFLDRHRQQ